MFNHQSYTFHYEKFFTWEINQLLDTYQIVPHKSRKECLSNSILGIINSRNVQLPEIAEGVQMSGITTSTSSIIHRLEDFFREVEFDYCSLALLLIFCLGKGKLGLCIDRTEWDFGKCQVNILMLTASDGKNQVPLFWELLDNKSGNSNAFDRIDLIKQVIDLVGVERIGIVIGDREFIGHRWLKYLKDKGINFCIRVPKHHLIERFDGEKLRIEELIINQPLYLKDCLVDGVWVNVYLKKLSDGDFLFLIGTLKEPKHLGQVYRKRWTIEVMFQSFKSRGFNIKNTHMKATYKLKKLVGLVAIAFVICNSLGIYKHKKVQKIKTKKHGYKAKSFCRTGIDWIRDVCKKSVEEFKALTNKFIRYLIRCKAKYGKLNYSLSDT